MNCMNFIGFSAVPVRLKTGYAGEPVFHISLLSLAAAAFLPLAVVAIFICQDGMYEL